VTRVGVLTYYRDGKAIRELRPAEEVFSPESLSTLRDAPVTDDHPWNEPGQKVTPANARALRRGHVSGEPRRDSDKIAAELVIDDAELIERIDTGLREVSCGYNCDTDETPGVYRGESYDRIQRNIRYNHVAIVRRGRAGSDVRIRLDSEDNAEIEDEDARTDADPYDEALAWIKKWAEKISEPRERAQTASAFGGWVARERLRTGKYPTLAEVQAHAKTIKIGTPDDDFAESVRARGKLNLGETTDRIRGVRRIARDDSDSEDEDMSGRGDAFDEYESSPHRRGEEAAAKKAKEAADLKREGDYAQALDDAKDIYEKARGWTSSGLPPGVTIQALQKAATLLKQRGHRYAENAARLIRDLKKEIAKDRDDSAESREDAKTDEEIYKALLAWLNQGGKLPVDDGGLARLARYDFFAVSPARVKVAIKRLISAGKQPKGYDMPSTVSWLNGTDRRKDSEEMPGRSDATTKGVWSKNAVRQAKSAIETLTRDESFNADEYALKDIHLAEENVDRGKKEGDTPEQIREAMTAIAAAKKKLAGWKHVARDDADDDRADASQQGGAKLQAPPSAAVTNTVRRLSAELRGLADDADESAGRFDWAKVIQDAESAARYAIQIKQAAQAAMKSGRSDSADPEIGNEDENMETIRIDGIDYPLRTPAECEAASRAHKRFADKAAKDAARADAAQMELATVQEELATANDPKRLDALVTERLALVATAAKIMGSEWKADGKTEIEIIRECVSKRSPASKARADSDETYARAAFDFAREAVAQDVDGLGELRAGTRRTPAQGSGRADSDEDQKDPRVKMRLDNAERASKPLAVTRD
jgi:hypothetical protein